MIRLAKHDDHWIAVHGGGPRFSRAISGGVHNRFRRWDRDKGIWLVHWQWVKWLVDYARTMHMDMDYTDLPHQWQLTAAGAFVPGRVTLPEDVKSPFEILYLTTEAPPEVVKAAYRALSKIHHPDMGGDAEKWREIDDAYRQLTPPKQSAPA